MWIWSYIPWAFLRRAVNHALLTYYGYLLPAFSSAKAIVQGDEESLQEWTTYWLVFSLFTILETVADVLISHWVLYLEFKILVFIWLSHRKFQGAYRVHELILHPLFTRYETDIDTRLGEARKHATATFNKTFRAIFISLFLDSNENFLATAIRKMTSSAEEDLRDLQDVVQGNLEHKRSRTGSIALSRNLVKDFADLLRTGLYINIGRERDETAMVFSQLDHAHTVLTFNNDADYPTPPGVPDRIALWRISTVTGGTDNDSCIAIDVDMSDDILTLYIQVPEEEDAGVLAMGIQLLVVSVKNKVKKGLRKLYRFTEITKMHSVLMKWRNLCNTDASGRSSNPPPKPPRRPVMQMRDEDDDDYYAARQGDEQQQQEEEEAQYGTYEANFDEYGDDIDDLSAEPHLSSASSQRLQFVLRTDSESMEYESSEYETSSNGGRSSGRFVSVRNRHHTVSYVQSDYSSDADHSDAYSDSAYPHPSSSRRNTRSPVIEEMDSPFEVLEPLDELPLTAGDSDGEATSVQA